MHNITKEEIENEGWKYTWTEAWDGINTIMFIKDNLQLNLSTGWERPKGWHNEIERLDFFKNKDGKVTHRETYDNKSLEEFKQICKKLN